MPKPKLTDSYIQEMGHRTSDLGPVLYIKIARYDGKPMGWEEIWQRFVNAHPDCWAVQVFPPESHVVNDANLYHLFVMVEGACPTGLTINR